MKFKTCVSVSETTPKKLKQVLNQALLQKRSEYAELRLDFLKPKDVPVALDLTKNMLDRCICTLRPKTEGGVFQGSAKERISILKLIAEYNPHLIDIEYNTISKNQKLFQYVRKTKTQILVSWHDFAATPKIGVLIQRLYNMKKFSSCIKIVTTAKNTTDVFTILSLYGKSHNVNLIAFAMGKKGKISRILSLYLNSPYSYVALNKARAVAPGQFSIDEIKKLQKIVTI